MGDTNAVDTHLNASMTGGQGEAVGILVEIAISDAAMSYRQQEYI